MSNARIYKQGWLNKRGEHIKTWRSRYFILKLDGNFLGYNSKPQNNDEIRTPNNTFIVKNCKILKSDKPRLNCFILTCYSCENITVERFFAASNSTDRDEWIKSIQYVSNLLKADFTIESISCSHKITLHDFEFLKIIGRGTFGKVILCRERFSKRLYAMKILKKCLIIEKNEIVHTETENKVLRTIKHPFLTSLIYSFQTTDCLCLVMEYVSGGELFFHLSRERKFTESKSRFYCAEICCAIGFLHENNIIYRDIKLENILLDNEGHIKLADFGLCKMNMTHESKTDTFCGTLEYLAPEIIGKKSTNEGYTRAIDWWACGVVLYEMLVGRLPFSSKSSDSIENRNNLFDKILYDEINLPSDLTLESKSILNDLLQKEPKKRLGSSILDFSEVKNHRFFDQIEWDKLFDKKIDPPFKPSINFESDTSNFETMFTTENVQLTPATSYRYLDSNTYYFDSFSYYGSKTSLNSQKSHSSVVLSAHSPSICRLKTDIYDTKSLLTSYQPTAIMNFPSENIPLSFSKPPSSSDINMFSSASDLCINNSVMKIRQKSTEPCHIYPNIVELRDDTDRSCQSDFNQNIYDSFTDFNNFINTKVSLSYSSSSSMMSST